MTGFERIEPESNECPACEDGYICRQGEGCILVEAFDREFVPNCDTEGS